MAQLVTVVTSRRREDLGLSCSLFECIHDATSLMQPEDVIQSTFSGTAALLVIFSVNFLLLRIMVNIKGIFCKMVLGLYSYDKH